MTSGLITHLLQSYGYYAVFVLIALESMGLPLPGESALIAAALYAGTTHHLSIPVLAAVAAAAAVIGDNAGYWIGRTGGQRLAERYGHYVRLDRGKLKVGRYLFARYGGKVVFFGRFVAILRTFAAFFAGVSHMRWSRFLVANAAGGILWAALYSFGAYALGGAASGVGNSLTIAGYVVASVATIGTIVGTRIWLRRLEQRADAAFPDEPADGPRRSADEPAVPAEGRSLTARRLPVIHPAGAAGRNRLDELRRRPPVPRERAGDRGPDRGQGAPGNEGEYRARWSRPPSGSSSSPTGRVPAARMPRPWRRHAACRPRYLELILKERNVTTRPSGYFAGRARVCRAGRCLRCRPSDHRLRSPPSSRR